MLYFRTESSLLSWDGWPGEGWDYKLYRKLPIMGLFLEELIFGGAFY